ncbi:unnamed protein product, partial [Polarella glacialis]
MEALEVDIRERRPSILIDENDPLERLARLIEGRKSKNQAEEQKEGADEVGEDGQPRPECTAGQAAGYAMASEVEEKASRKPVQEGFDSRPSISSSQPGVDESRTQARRTSHSSRPGTGDTATGKDNFRPKRASGMPSEIREMRDSASSGWQQAAAVSMSGLPDGFASFWRAVKGGKELSASERQRSRIFYRAWGLYRRRVEKWFDYAVSPHLEVWRQRGIRPWLNPTLDRLMAVSRRQKPIGAAAEAFGRMTREEDAAAARESTEAAFGPAARMSMIASRATQTANLARPSRQPTFRRAPTFHSGRTAAFEIDEDDDDDESDFSYSPALLACPLPLQITQMPTQTLLCARLVQSPVWRRSLVPQKLSAEALVSAAKQLFLSLTAARPEQIDVSGAEIEIIVPRTVLQIRGAGGCEVVCGVRLSGIIRSEKQVPLPEHQGLRARCPSSAPSSSAASACADEDKPVTPADPPSAPSPTFSQPDQLGIVWTNWMRVDAKNVGEDAAGDVSVADFTITQPVEGAKVQFSPGYPKATASFSPERSQQRKGSKESPRLGSTFGGGLSRQSGNDPNSPGGGAWTSRDDRRQQTAPRTAQTPRGGGSTGGSWRQHPIRGASGGDRQTERLLPPGAVAAAAKLPVIDSVQGWKPMSTGGLTRTWHTPRAGFFGEESLLPTLEQSPGTPRAGGTDQIATTTPAMSVAASRQLRQLEEVSSKT